jgi:hypothetical protein
MVLYRGMSDKIPFDQNPFHVFLAHLSQSDGVSFCDRFSSGVRPSVRRP